LHHKSKWKIEEIEYSYFSIDFFTEKTACFSQQFFFQTANAKRKNQVKIKKKSTTSGNITGGQENIQNKNETIPITLPY
jgi:hypothetical protein